MKINWKLRLQNKTTLYSIILDVVLIIFTLIDLIKAFPAITPDQVMSVVALVIEVFVLLGIVIDPTTEGVSDSIVAHTYTAPRDSKTDPIILARPVEDSSEVEIISELPPIDSLAGKRE